MTLIRPDIFLQNALSILTLILWVSEMLFLKKKVMVILSATNGFMDDVPVNRIQEFQNGFLSFVQASASNLSNTLSEKKELTKDLEDQLRQALTDFKARTWKK